MPSNYIKLKEFLTPSQKESLLKQAHETTDWIVHKSSKSGKLEPLHFKRIDTHIVGSKELLMMMKPNAIQDWHTDMKGRNVSVAQDLVDFLVQLKKAFGFSDAAMKRDRPFRLKVFVELSQH